MKQLPENYHTTFCYWAQLVTLRCNGGCPYCILNRRGRHVPRAAELSGKRILEFWNGIEHRQGQRLSLIGGETTLHKDFVEIVNNLNGYAITVTTNCKTPFFEAKSYEKLNPLPSSTLRVNTTFHPHHISSEEYITVIRELRKKDFFVDQTSYVLYPNYPEEYKKEVARVAEEIEIYDSPYLGFWSGKKGFDAEPCPENNEMKEDYAGKSNPAILSGIIDFEAYRDMCGQAKQRHCICWHPMNALIIDPEGYYYPCHYRLYYAIEPICHIDDFRPVNNQDMKCNYYGKCSWCDVPRVSCLKNPTVASKTD